MANQYPAAVTELRSLGYKRRSLAYMKERLTKINAAKYTVNSGTASATPTAHGGTRYEDRLDNLIMKADTAVAECAALRASCFAVETALAALTEEERAVLELCYMERPYGWITEGQRRLCFTRSRLYEIKDIALEHYTILRNKL